MARSGDSRWGVVCVRFALACGAAGCSLPAEQRRAEEQSQTGTWRARLAQAHEHAARRQAQRSGKDSAPTAEARAAATPARSLAGGPGRAERVTPPTEMTAQAPAPLAVEVLVPEASPAQGLARARAAVRIDMYSTSWCGVCTTARRYLRQHQIRFVEHDVDHSAAARARSRVLNPRRSVPTIAIDDHVLVGFGADSFEELYDRAATTRMTRAVEPGPKPIEVGAASSGAPQE
jgi:glutaredoxin